MKIGLVLLILLLALPSFSNSFLPEKFMAQFEQSFVSSVSGKKKKSFGKLDYMYPGHVRFETELPERVTYVSNAKSSWYYTPPFIATEQGEVIVQNKNNSSLSMFFDSLHSGLKNNKFYDVKIDKEGTQILFKEAKASEIGVKKALLKSKKTPISSLADVDSIVLLYTTNKEVDLSFVRFDGFASFNKGHFEFNIPKNTRITRQ